MGPLDQSLGPQIIINKALKLLSSISYRIIFWGRGGGAEVQEWRGGLIVTL